MPKNSTLLNPRNFPVCILVGPQSKRYGKVKAFLKLGSMSLLESMRERLMATFPQIYIIHDPHVMFSTEHHIGLERSVPDLYLDHGPLGGMYTAFRKLNLPYAFFLGSDMPLVEPRLVYSLAQYFRSRPHLLALLPRVGRKLQPLFACYSRKVLPLLEACLARQKFKVFSFVSSLRQRETLDESFLRRYDPTLQSFHNINFPKDLARIQRLTGLSA